MYYIYIGSISFKSFIMIYEWLLLIYPLYNFSNSLEVILPLNANPIIKLPKSLIIKKSLDLIRNIVDNDKKRCIICKYKGRIKRGDYSANN